MKKKCLNYKFFVLSVYPLLGLFLACLFMLFTPRVGGYIGGTIFALSALCATVLSIIEPVSYEIDGDGIRVVGLFKKQCFPWRKIRCICTAYDVFFEFFLVEDYLLIMKDRRKYPERFLRIVKCKKTQRLIKQYASAHGICVLKNF